VTGKDVTFLLGGARSGKSRLGQQMAEEQAVKTSARLVYLATGQAFDTEMTDRIARHQADRGPTWRTVECPLDLPAALNREAVMGQVVLIDCLTLWTSNLLLSNADMERAADDLLNALDAVQCPVVVVSNEVGLGIVPDHPLGRLFRDEAGRLHQRIAEVATVVMLVAAGLTLRMK
jgi:adenosylcobinamide kinase/adenosylcobinamide-phosphate guanylyltransferase